MGSREQAVRSSPRLTSTVPANNTRYDGAAIRPAYKPREFAGPLPTADVENPSIFTGGCHCGNVSIAVKAKPLPSKGQALPEIRGPGSPFSEHMEYIQECNCSICIRVCVCSLHRNSTSHISLLLLLPCCNLCVPLNHSNLTLHLFRMVQSLSILSAPESPSQTQATASRRTRWAANSSSTSSAQSAVSPCILAKKDCRKTRRNGQIQYRAYGWRYCL